MSQPYVGEIILAAFTFAPQGWAFCDGQLLPISENESLFQLIGTIYGGDGEVTFALPDLRSRIPVGTGQGPGLSLNYVIGEAAGSETITLTSAQMPAHTHTIDATGLTAAVRVKNGAGTQSAPTGNVFAIASQFTNPTLTAASDVIRAVHVTELRTRIDAYRSSVGLPPFPYTDPTLASGATAVKAVHVAELRTSLRQAYMQAKLPPPAFTDDPLTAGTTAKAIHITELRGAVTAVAGGAAAYSSALPTANMAAGTVALTGSVSPATGGNQPHDNRQPYLGLNYCISLFGIFPPLP